MSFPEISWRMSYEIVTVLTTGPGSGSLTCDLQFNMNTGWNGMNENNEEQQKVRSGRHEDTSRCRVQPIPAQRGVSWGQISIPLASPGLRCAAQWGPKISARQRRHLGAVGRTPGVERQVR